MVFWKIERGDLSRPRIDYLRAIAVAPIDFDSLTPDLERNVADGKAKTVSIARSESRTWDQGFKQLVRWLRGGESRNDNIWDGCRNLAAG